MKNLLKRIIRPRWNWLWQFVLGNTGDGEVILFTNKWHHRQIVEDFWEIVAERLKV